MTAPALAAARFAAAFLLGAALGPVYDFLRPLRPRLTALADLLFLMPATGAWLYLNFAVCRGDIRLGYVLGIPLGLILWEKTLSFLFRPIFSIFWLPGKKILQFFRKISKKLFASAKKWVTIYWTKNEHQTKEGGRKHAAHFTQTQADPLCVSPEQSADQDRGPFRHRSVRGGSADSGPHHRRRPKSHRRPGRSGRPVGAGKSETGR
ncbi:MAG: hypothetical protein E7436_05405 [Ruminococcaceae bacterium]|nr:hypothetical protein [Oscillospiraceae bacterium]